jgi:acetyl-CoA carboxylase biotin carboxylase subunit
MLAKLVVWAPDRNAAIARMRRALSEFEIGGERLHTTREFLIAVLDNRNFRTGDHSTALVTEMLDHPASG